MMEHLVWNGHTQAALDAAYNNSAAVADSADRIANWTQRSTALKARQPHELDISYAPNQRTRFDIFRSGHQGAPLLVFIHGGWWQRNSKDVFSCMAEGPMARGFDVALLGYTLAPDARLTQIASEIRSGLDAIMAHQEKHGAPTKCILSGWSAGGHLTALTLDHPAVTAGLSISGVFDLNPIKQSYINDKLRLDDDEATAHSPALTTPCPKPIALAFGLRELPELQRQSADYGKLRVAKSAPTLGFPLWGHDHFSILEELASPDGALVAMLMQLSKLDPQNT